ncbi:hypothetical protein ABBQ32_002629 [Trebouxia sp. C0010 RCD-2024]
MLAIKTPLAQTRLIRTTRPSRTKIARCSVSVRARSSGQRDSNKAVLEAFFLGRAFAEAINDRLGAALGDLLSEFGKADAERRQFWKEFEAEVQDRASAALSKATQSSKYTQRQLPENATLPRTTTGAPIGPVPTRRGQQQTSSASQRLLQESVDDVRAEVAAARSELQRFRSTRNNGRL